MTHDLIALRVKGYEWALRADYDGSGDADIIDGFAATTGLHWASETDAYEAFAMGAEDAARPTEDFYLTPQDAAQMKGVTLKSLYRLLRDDKRRAAFFPRAVVSGEGRRREYRLHPDDVKQWTVRRRAKAQIWSVGFDGVQVRVFRDLRTSYYETTVYNEDGRFIDSNYGFMDDDSALEWGRDVAWKELRRLRDSKL